MIGKANFSDEFKRDAVAPRGGVSLMRTFAKTSSAGIAASPVLVSGRAGASSPRCCWHADQLPDAPRLVNHSAPEVVHLCVDMVEMPSPVPEAFHPADPLAADVGSEQRADAVPPGPDDLLSDIDSALEQWVFDVPQRQR